MSLNAKFDTVITPLSIDVSIGDAITPNPVLFSFNEIFAPEKSFELWAYNIETVLAEKVETILRRSVFNTRPRDFYDAYILATTQEYDKAVFADALSATAKHRGAEQQISDTEEIMRIIFQSKDLHTMLDKYRKQLAYAKDIEFDAIVDKISSLANR